MTPRRKRPIDAGQFDQRMKVMELWSVEHQLLGAISEQLGVSERTLRRWLADVPRVRLGRSGCGPGPLGSPGLGHSRRSEEPWRSGERSQARGRRQHPGRATLADPRGDQAGTLLTLITVTGTPNLRLIWCGMSIPSQREMFFGSVDRATSSYSPGRLVNTAEMAFPGFASPTSPSTRAPSPRSTPSPNSSRLRACSQA